MDRATPTSRDDVGLQHISGAESLDRLGDFDDEVERGWSDDEWGTDVGEEWESGEGEGDAEDEDDRGLLHRRTRSWPWSVEGGSEGERTVSDSEDDADDDEAVSAEWLIDMSSARSPCSYMICARVWRVGFQPFRF